MPMIFFVENHTSEMLLIFVVESHSIESLCDPVSLGIWKPSLQVKLSQNSTRPFCRLGRRVPFKAEFVAWLEMGFFNR